MKFIQKRTIKSNLSGITLIALVITIVILLILSGVSITMLLGESGIIKQAKNAKEKTEIASAIEQVSLSVTSSMMKNGNINYEDLKTELTKIEKISGVPENINNSSFPLILSIGKSNIKISSDGSVTQSPIPTGYSQVEYIAPSNINDMQYIVTNYSLDYSKDFTISGSFSIPNLDKRYLIIGNYNNQANLNIEVTENNQFRIYATTDIMQINFNAKPNVFYDFSLSYIAQSHTFIANINGFSASEQKDINGIGNDNLRIGNSDYRGYIVFDKIHIKHLMAYKDSLKVFDLIPCFKNSENKAGMYDTINNLFYINSGPGDFSFET